MTPGRRAVLFALALILLGAVAVLLRIRWEGWHPQVVLFIYSIPANAAISLLSHEVALLDYGTDQPLFLTTAVATAATVVAGFLDWHVFVPLFQTDTLRKYRENRFVRYCTERFETMPFTVIFVTAFTPVPFAPFKVLAFSANYPLVNYLTAVGLARAPRYLLLLWVGHKLQLATWILGIGLVLAFVVGLWHIRRDWQKLLSGRRTD